MNAPKLTKHFRQLALLALAAAVDSAHAANGVWIGAGADGNRHTTPNWTGGVIPGVTNSNTVSTDSALFNISPTQTIITMDTNRNVKNFTFGTGNLGVFAIGSAGANPGTPHRISWECV